MYDLKNIPNTFFKQKPKLLLLQLCYNIKQSDKAELSDPDPAEQSDPDPAEQSDPDSAEQSDPDPAEQSDPDR